MSRFLGMKSNRNYGGFLPFSAVLDSADSWLTPNYKYLHLVRNQTVPAARWLQPVTKTSTIEITPVYKRASRRGLLQASMPNKLVVAVLEDLLFTVKISDAAKRAGLQTQFVKTEEATLERAKEKPLLIIIDLNCGSVDPVALIGTLKSGDTAKIPLIGFVSHVQGELKQRAHEAGCDMVMARSAFSQNLAQILKRHAGSV
jgi:CheY-like chemotaxis protein